MTNWINTIDSVLLVVGFGTLIGSLILPAIFRNTLAIIVNMIISPFASHLPFILVLTVIAIVISFVATVVQKYKTDTNLAMSLNKKNLILQKEMREAQKSGNKKTLKKLEEEQALLLADQSKVSIQQLKSTGYTAIVSIPLIMWINWYLGAQTIPITMSIPLLGTHAFTETLLIMPYWCLWLSVCSIAIGYVIRKIINNISARSAMG